MDSTLEQRIEAAHSDAERVENDARAIEARIVAAGGEPPTRPYGRPVSGDDIRKNLTLTSLLQRKELRWVPTWAWALITSAAAKKKPQPGRWQPRRCKCKPSACGRSMLRLLATGSNSSLRALIR